MSLPKLTRYECGYTEQNVARLYKSSKAEKRLFSSNAFLFQHPRGESILFDTGYATSYAGTGLKGHLYQLVLRPQIEEKDSIAAQLQTDGISPGSITHVVLSHMHPDHIGGVKYFPDAQFVLSEEAQQGLESPKLTDILIPGLLPGWFEDANKLVLNKSQLGATAIKGMQGYDLLGDGSYVLTELPGHARGHLGALVLSRAMLAADASWGRDLLSNSDDLRIGPKIITHDVEKYKQTAENLQKLESTGIDLYFSHDANEGKEIF